MGDGVGSIIGQTPGTGEIPSFVSDRALVVDRVFLSWGPADGIVAYVRHSPFDVGIKDRINELSEETLQNTPNRLPVLLNSVPDSLTTPFPSDHRSRHGKSRSNISA